MSLSLPPIFPFQHTLSRPDTCWCFWRSPYTLASWRVASVFDGRSNRKWTRTSSASVYWPSCVRHWHCNKAQDYEVSIIIISYCFLIHQGKSINELTSVRWYSLNLKLNNTGCPYIWTDQLYKQEYSSLRRYRMNCIIRNLIWIYSSLTHIMNCRYMIRMKFYQMFIDAERGLILLSVVVKFPGHIKHLDIIQIQ